MSKSRSRYVPSLDGMRALAVLAVIAYHMKMDWAPGGLLGVTMFFVLSGYLITGLLVKEAHETQTISLKNFWIRRIRRIIPAVVFAVVGIAFLCTIFNHALLTKMRPDTLPTLFFFNNWWQIFHNVSYFEALGQPSPLTHFWSLAIEEQFYLIWPVILLVCVKLGVSKTMLIRGTAVLAALSFILMLVMFDPAADPSRVYYGTDTRAFSLLIGALLSFVWPYQKFYEDDVDVDNHGNLYFNLVGVGALLGLVLMIVFTNGFAPFIYRGGLLLCSLLTAVVIAVLVHPQSWISKLFSLRPFVWIGKLSYSMYLWHFPLILLMTSSNMVGQAPVWLRLIQLIAIFAVSAFSYYVIENPIRKGFLSDLIYRLRDREFTLVEWIQMHVIPVAAGALFVLIAIGGLLFVPNTSALQNAESIQGTGEVESANINNNETNAVQTPKSDHAYDMLLIGDSVPAATEAYGVFYDYFPYGHIDAVMSRRYDAGLAVYEEYSQGGYVGDNVIFALGTNGYVTDEILDKVVATVGSDKNIWLVNTQNQMDYMQSNNDALARCAQKYGNVNLIDWHGLSAALGDEVFDGDGMHLSLHGCHVYLDMIKNAIIDKLPERSRNPVAQAPDAAVEPQATG